MADEMVRNSRTFGYDVSGSVPTDLLSSDGSGISGTCRSCGNAASRSSSEEYGRVAEGLSTIQRWWNRAIVGVCLSGVATVLVLVVEGVVSRR